MLLHVGVGLLHMISDLYQQADWNRAHSAGGVAGIVVLCLRNGARISDRVLDAGDARCGGPELLVDVLLCQQKQFVCILGALKLCHGLRWLLMQKKVSRRTITNATECAIDKLTVVLFEGVVVKGLPTQVPCRICLVVVRLNGDAVLTALLKNFGRMWGGAQLYSNPIHVICTDRTTTSIDGFTAAGF